MTNPHQTNSSLELDRLSNKALWVFLGCVAFFIFSLVVSAITASKITEISVFGWAIAIPVGTSLFAITFISTDVISEVWGARIARKVVIMGLMIRISMALFLAYAVALEPAPYWANQDAYQSILSSSSRILLAGILTYPVSQLADIWIFHRLKERQKGKDHLWIRNNVSTFSSQVIDSVLFIAIAFYGIFEPEVLVSMIIGQVAVKWFIALCDTPFVYFLRNLAVGRKWNDLRG